MGRCSPPNNSTIIILQLSDFLASAFQRGNDMILSTECLDKPEVNIETLKNVLQLPNKYPTAFETTVILYYRPLLEWIPSLYFERQRDKRKNATPYESFVEWLTHERIDLIMKEYTWTVRERYERMGFDVKILPMRKTEDSVVKFFCDYLPNADHTCATVKAIKEDDETATIKNVRQSIEYQRILGHALEEGLLSEDANRPKDKEQFTQFVRRVGVDYIRKFIICLPEQTREKPLDLALFSDDQMSCSMASQDSIMYFQNNCTSDNERTILEAKIREVLWSNDESSWCSFNTTLILEDVEWREFFKSLK